MERLEIWRIEYEDTERRIEREYQQSLVDIEEEYRKAAEKIRSDFEAERRKLIRQSDGAAHNKSLTSHSSSKPCTNVATQNYPFTAVAGVVIKSKQEQPNRGKAHFVHHIKKEIGATGKEIISAAYAAFVYKRFATSFSTIRMKHHKNITERQIKLIAARKYCNTFPQNAGDYFISVQTEKQMSLLSCITANECEWIIWKCRVNCLFVIFDPGGISAREPVYLILLANSTHITTANNDK
ncbi:uncharacterized protein LOC134225670 [Armigeres subalbatus]|uniref:uncharacterized protein LOC134225670 n=1 Tax=Armigeres subalbatus TaxID=124917 RepID=UPI002ED3FEF7